MQDLPNALEAAVKVILDAEETGVHVFLGQTEETQVRPCCTVWAQSGEERPIGSGNFMVTLSVAIRTNAFDEEIQNHRERCRNLLGVLMEDDICTQLSDTGLLSVFGPETGPKRSREDKEDDSWITELSFDVYCCLELLGTEAEVIEE